MEETFSGMEPGDGIPEFQPCWDVIGLPLERAALALGRLDAALDGHPLRPAWQFRTEMDAACRCAAADGHRIDPVHLAVVANGMTVDPEARRGSVALAWALEVRSALSAGDRRRWAVPRHPSAATTRIRRGRPPADPDMIRARTALARERLARAAGLRELRGALRTLRAAGRSRPALLGTALGAHAWLSGGGSRNALRGALPLYLAERSASRTQIAGLTGVAALDADAPSGRDPWLARFLSALADEAADGLLRLRSLERTWTAARRRVDAKHRGDGAGSKSRSTSRLPQAIDILAATPLLGPASLARALGLTRAGASRMLERAVELDLAVEITGRGSHKLYALPDLSHMQDEIRRSRAFQGSTARIRAHGDDGVDSDTASDVNAEGMMDVILKRPEMPPLVPGERVGRDARGAPPPDLQADLDAALAGLEEPLRRVRSTLSRLAAKTRPDRDEPGG